MFEILEIKTSFLCYIITNIKHITFLSLQGMDIQGWISSYYLICPEMSLSRNFLNLIIIKFTNGLMKFSPASDAEGIFDKLVLFTKYKIWHVNTKQNNGW